MQKNYGDDYMEDYAEEETAKNRRADENYEYEGSGTRKRRGADDYDYDGSGGGGEYDTGTGDTDGEEYDAYGEEQMPSDKEDYEGLLNALSFTDAMHPSTCRIYRLR